MAPATTQPFRASIAGMGILLATGVLSLAPDDTLRFAPAQGWQLTKAFHRTLEVELEEGSLEISNRGTRSKLPLDRWSFVEEQRIELVDEYLAVAGSKPTQLRRTFADLSGELKGRCLDRDEAFTEKGSGILKGATVLFVLDQAGEAYVPGYELPDPHDEALLEGLEGEADLIGVLPDKPVSPGDEWETSPELLRRICRPGGAIAYESYEGEHVFLEPWLEGVLEGRMRVRYAGEPSVGEAQAALLKIRGRVEIREEPSEGPGGVDLTFTTIEGWDRIESSAEFVVEGEVLWDLDAGCLLDADFDVQMVLEAEVHSVANDRELESWTRIRFTGSLRVGASFR